MANVLDIALVIAIAAVFVTLCLGVYSLMRGGEFARSNSNRLMRLRVILQFIAVIILMAAFWWRGTHG